MQWFVTGRHYGNRVPWQGSLVSSPSPSEDSELPLINGWLLRVLSLWKCPDRGGSADC